MSTPNVETNANVVNAPPPEVTPQSTPLTPTPSQPTQESNPFSFAESLVEMGALKQEEPTAQPTQETTPQETTNTPTTTAPQETTPEASQEEIDRILATDSKLKEFQLLTDAGYTPEDALKMVYEQQEQPEPEPQQEIIPQPQQLREIYENIIKSPQDFEAIQRRAYSPTQEDIASYFAANKIENLPDIPELMTIDQIKQEFDLDEGTEQLVGYMLNALSGFNSVFSGLKQQNTLLATKLMTQEYQGHLKNIGQLAQEHSASLKAQQTLASSLDSKIYTALPMLKDNPHPGIKAQFNEMLKSRAMSIPKHLAAHGKILEKITEQTVKDFKAIYPTLCKKFGIDQQPTTQPQLADLQKAEMQNVSSSAIPSSGNNAQFAPEKYDMSQPGQFGNALVAAGVLRKE